MSLEIKTVHLIIAQQHTSGSHDSLHNIYLYCAFTALKTIQRTTETDIQLGIMLLCGSFIFFKIPYM